MGAEPSPSLISSADAIQCDKITKIFKRGTIQVNALAEVTVTIALGEFVALRGPSGSGKSTLLNIIGCLERATSGRVLIHGRDVSRLRPLEAGRVRRAAFGFVLQELALLTHLTTTENVCLPLIFDGSPQTALSNAVEAALETAAIRHKANQYPWELSAGERQRVAIARALVHQPKILLADEPTANLDSTNADNISDVFRGIRDRGGAVIAATHDDRLSRHADRVIWMMDGKVDMFGNES